MTILILAPHVRRAAAEGRRASGFPGHEDHFFPRPPVVGEDVLVETHQPRPLADSPARPFVLCLAGELPMANPGAFSPDSRGQAGGRAQPIDTQSRTL